jgi:hypothetical protein
VSDTGQCFVSVLLVCRSFEDSYEKILYVLQGIVDTLCGQNGELLNVKLAVHIVTAGL